MQSQVVGAGEAALAVRTLERFDPRVLAVVSRQLIRAGELPCAAFPRALVGLLTCTEREKRHRLLKTRQTGAVLMPQMAENPPHLCASYDGL